MTQRWQVIDDLRTPITFLMGKILLPSRLDTHWSNSWSPSPSSNNDSSESLELCEDYELSSSSLIISSHRTFLPSNFHPSSSSCGKTALLDWPPNPPLINASSSALEPFFLPLFFGGGSVAYCSCVGSSGEMNWSRSLVF